MMQKNNLDKIPVRVSHGEHIASNPALDHVLGRAIIPAANKLALAMDKHRAKLGAHKKKPNAKPKGDEKELVHNAKEEAMEGVEGYALGTRLPSGVQRIGNSYSQIGAAPIPMQGISNAPSPNLLPAGAQRVGNSYTDGNSGSFVGRQRNPFANDGEATYGYADGTKEPEGVQPPSLMDTVSGVFSVDDEPQAVYIPQKLGQSAPTLDQATKNYQLQPPVQRFAIGVTKPSGVQEEDINTIGTGGNLLSARLVRAPSNGTPSIVPQGQEVAPVQPQKQFGSAFTDKAGLSTLSGNGFSVSSNSPTLVGNPTPQSLSALDSTIAYNQTPEAKAKFAENAAISEKNYADGRAFDAARQTAPSFQVPDQPDYSPGIENALAVLNKSPETMGFGAMIADKKARDNAKAVLGALTNLQQDAKRTGVDYAQIGQRGSEANQQLGLNRENALRENELGQAKIAADTQNAYLAGKDKERQFGLEQQKFGLEQEKANQPTFQNIKEYNDLGQVIGEKPVALSKQTGQPIKPAPASALAHLKANPQTKADFIAMYGYDPGKI